MLLPETVTFLEGGCSLVVGTVGPGGDPHATRGWGITVVSSAPADVRLLLDAADAVALEHLATNARISLTGGDVRTLRSIQLKGTAGAIEPATDADRLRARCFCDDFFASVSAVDGTPRELMEPLVPRDFVTCIVRATELYDQTPGPAAGLAIDPDAS